MPTNRLANESSPYLLQHAHNPVEWYPWGPEAFDRARREDRPIFLSVGYSTCYWCHVMERQCFENPAIADVMNELFVCIKVDREERPDVDQLYMTAVQVQTHQGGWPMNVFLTPDLRYFYGGTYFPPEASYGRPGFVTLLRAVSDAWKNRRDEVLRSADQFTQVLRQAAITPRPRTELRITPLEVARCVLESTSDFDPAQGGYGRAPKFPRQTLLELLLAATAPGAPTAVGLSKYAPQIEGQLKQTLDGMMYGGIRDQLAGGFHRYSTDANWLVPHFEIMLYDNAMLGWVYTEAAGRFQDARYAVVARELFDFVLREMTSAEGAFYTAIDAEVDAQEGRSYLWTPEEVRQILTAQTAQERGPAFSPGDAELFSRVFGLDRGFNFADPHHGSGVADQNILFVAEPALYHQHHGLLSSMRRLLLEYRQRRKQPLLDTKVITQWNALMIRALAKAGKSLQEPRYLNAAVAAAEFLLRHHRSSDGSILRSSRDGSGKYLGYLDDYSCLADSLLTLHDATADGRWRAAAEDMAGEMSRRFRDSSAGGFFSTDAAADDLLVRQKTASDSPLPSGNSAAATVLLRLGKTDLARQVLASFAEQSMQHVGAMSSMLEAIIRFLSLDQELTVPPRGENEVDQPVAAGRKSRVVNAFARKKGEHQFEVELTIEAGWHISDHHAAAGLISTRISVLDDPEAQVHYPAGEVVASPARAPAITGYRGTVRVPIKTSLCSGTVRIDYQACASDRCLQPEHLLVEFGV